MEYNTSDKLAIALACLAGMMAIGLFLVEKTPVTVFSLLALMLALSIYPILHFAKRIGSRVALFVAVIVGTLFLGWSVWPPAHPISANTQTPQSSSEKKPEEEKTESPKPTANKIPPKAKTEQHSQGNNSPNVGSITQGPGSIAQVGGQGNQATVNNFGPPPPKFEVIPLSKNVLEKDGSYATKFQMTITSSSSIPSLLIRAESPTVTDFILLIENSDSTFTSHNRGGVGFYQRKFNNIEPGVYTVLVEHKQPEEIKLIFGPN